MDIKPVLKELRDFVEAEHQANQAKLYEVWKKPLEAKLKSGESQKISNIQIDSTGHLVLTLAEGESRFREGDMLCLHTGDPFTSSFVKQATIEEENDGEWFVRTGNQDKSGLVIPPGDVFADPDNMDLKPFYDKALDDIANSSIGRSVILPMLAGELDISIVYPENFDNAADYAEDYGLTAKQPLNDSQIEAVGLGAAAKYVACIQGPPGTGKTKVISLIAKRLVEEGHRVLVTSHTHMAINNALNKIAKEKVPLIKVGALIATKSLDKSIKCFKSGDEWEDRPDSGYVIGATPFATCSSRLENFLFDTVIFDEASQVTVALAVMAMRKARRFVFVGDHKQLPPVVLSKSVLSGQTYSVFSKLVSESLATSVMLDQTYRMCDDLSRWPSKKFYKGNLVSAGSNKSRKFKLPKPPSKYQPVLSSDHAFVFITSPGVNAKSRSKKEADLVVDIVATAVDAGMKLEEIGVVSPYRNHGKMLRTTMSKRLGIYSPKKVVTDTVERMQGQEREMIIVSLCTTDPQFLRAVASFFFQSERLNVAITRPMTKLILIGPKLDDDFVVDIRDEELTQRVEDYKSLVDSAYDCTAYSEAH